MRYVSDLPDVLAAPVTAGTAAGTLHVLADDREVYSETLYVRDDLRFSRRMYLVRNIKAFWQAHGTAVKICAGGLILLYILLKSRKQHRRKRRRSRKSRH